MSRMTKAELELENSEYREKLSEMYDAIGELLGVDDSSDEDQDDEDDEES